MLIEALRALLLAGIPIAFLSYYLIHWAFKRGLPVKKDKTDKSQESDDNNAKNKKKKAKREKTGNLAYDKWALFGGGYYGIMALATWLHVEILDIYRAFSAFESLSHFLDSISVHFFIGLIIEAITNLITAFVWFTYWDDVIAMDSPLLWLAVSYLAYFAGERLAEHRLKAQAMTLE